MRKLATVRVCNNVLSIPGADRIELAVVDGWQCVVGKGMVRPEDIGVYIECDSFLPNEPRWKYLEKNCFKMMGDIPGYKIRTCEFKKQLSQGLFIPLKEFPELCESKIGDDVTEKLGIQLWDPPAPLEISEMVEHVAPAYLSSDQERIQNLPSLFETNEEHMYEVSIKLDGESVRYVYNNDKFLVCSPSWAWKDLPKNIGWQIAKKYHINEILEWYCKHTNSNLALLGELVGPSYQGNNDKLEENDFYLYDILDINCGKKIIPTIRVDMLEAINDELYKRHGVKIKHVPIIGYKFIFHEFKTMNELLAYANGPSLNSNCNREGIVCKSNWDRSSFKVISNKYLLEHD